MGVVLPGGCTFWESIVGKSSSSTNENKSSDALESATNTPISSAKQKERKTGVKDGRVTKKKRLAQNKINKQRTKARKVNATDAICGYCEKSFLDTDNTLYKLDCECLNMYHSGCMEKMESNSELVCKFCTQHVKKGAAIEQKVDDTANESDDESQDENDEDMESEVVTSDDEGNPDEANNEEKGKDNADWLCCIAGKNSFIPLFF